MTHGFRSAECVKGKRGKAQWAGQMGSGRANRANTSQKWAIQVHRRIGASTDLAPARLTPKILDNIRTTMLTGTDQRVELAVRAAIVGTHLVLAAVSLTLDGCGPSMPAFQARPRHHRPRSVELT